MPVKQLHVSELFIRYAHDAHMAFGRKKTLHPPDVHLRIFAAAAVPYVHAELKHLKTVFQNFLPEQGIVLPVLFGFGRKVEKYEDPHNSIGVKTGKHGTD